MERSLSNTLPAFGPARRHWLSHALASLRRWLRNARTRRQLAKLDERLLSDAGISNSERLAELDKPFWR